MSAKILHLQCDGSTGTVEAGFQRLSLLAEKGSGAVLDEEKLARVEAGRLNKRHRQDGTPRADALRLAGGGEQYLVLDRLSGIYVKWQCRMVQRGRRGIVWLSDEVLSNRFAATSSKQQKCVVFLTVDQALRFSGCGRVRTAVIVLKKDCPGGLVVSDGVTSFAEFADFQELFPLLVRHHGDPVKRVETFFSTLAWCLANDVPWQEATKQAQADAVVDWSPQLTPIVVPYPTVVSANDKSSAWGIAKTVSAISAIAAAVVMASFVFMG